MVERIQNPADLLDSIIRRCLREHLHPAGITWHAVINALALEWAIDEPVFHDGPHPMKLDEAQFAAAQLALAAAEYRARWCRDRHSEKASRLLECMIDCAQVLSTDHLLDGARYAEKQSSGIRKHRQRKQTQAEKQREDWQRRADRIIAADPRMRGNKLSVANAIEAETGSPAHTIRKYIDVDR